MIGYDLCSLDHIQSKHSQSSRFESRILTKSDRERFSSNRPPSLIWVAWTAKESCFKALRGKRIFNPHHFCIERMTPSTDGIDLTIQGKDHTFFVRTWLTENHIESVAVTKRSTLDLVERRQVIGHFDDPKKQSEAVRDLIRRHFNEQEQREVSVVNDDNGIPHLISDPSFDPPFLSISHHGNVAGFAYLRA